MGRSGRVAMIDLRRALEKADVDVAATILQSGNLLVANWTESTEILASKVSSVLMEEFSIRSPSVVRTPQELSKVIESNPLASIVTNDGLMNVHFVEPRLTAAKWLSTGFAALDPLNLAVAAGSLYQWCPNGLSNSPAVSVRLERTLGSAVTVRNIRTVRRILEACR